MNHIKMKTIAILIFLAGFIMIGWAGTPPVKKTLSAPVQVQKPVPVNPPPEQPLGKLIITSPKPGDYLVAGREFVIQWSAEGYVPEKCVRIAYIQMPFAPFEINPRVCVNGYRWNVPANMLGDNYYIQLTTLDQKIKVRSERFSIMSGKPDLDFYSWSTIPKNPTTADRDNLKLNATIINKQAGKSVPCQARITFGPQNGNASQLVSKIFDVPTLNMGDRHTISLAWPPGASLSPGGYSFQVDLDITHVVDEQSEGNNHIDQYVLVQGLPNLVVCVKDRLEAITTKEAKLRAIVKNTGEVTSGISIARWRIEGHGTQNFNVPNLGPGQTFEIKREVIWLTGGTDNFTVEVDKNNQVRELSETDNVKNGTIKRHVWGTPVAPFDNSPKCPEYGIN
ncbi:MAG: hypothetical protein EHM45_07450 [Desulfobacteraceae bacterium]|nr:MAG: hypothetical protein EHM45_07450 [Desulfobacteraceae bacterium]